MKLQFFVFIILIIFLFYLNKKIIYSKINIFEYWHSNINPSILHIPTQIRYDNCNSKDKFINNLKIKNIEKNKNNIQTKINNLKKKNIELKIDCNNKEIKQNLTEIKLLNKKLCKLTDIKNKLLDKLNNSNNNLC